MRAIIKETGKISEIICIGTLAGNFNTGLKVYSDTKTGKIYNEKDVFLIDDQAYWVKFRMETSRMIFMDKFRMGDKDDFNIHLMAKESVSMADALILALEGREVQQ